MKSLTETLIAMERHRSIFENEIRTLPVPVCRAFGDQAKPMPPSFVSSGQVLSTRYSNSVGASFPHTTSESGNAVLRSSSSLAAMPKGKRVAALFSGGPASGGHNVLCGLKTILGSENTLLGVRGGPKGLLSGKLFVINDDDAAGIVNTGGFDFLGTDRTKIKTDEQYRQVKQVCTDNQIDAIVIIGGDDSNTNAALLAEYLHSDVRANDAGVPVGVQVIGVPKTIDGDLQVEGLLPISFGFDTATKIYAEMVGNILQDTPSSRKYWHFVKLMGRSASHVTLEVALQTKPAVALISEELAQRKLSLSAVIDMIANTVIARGRKGIYHGVVLIPEGLLEFIPQVKSLIDELNDKLVQLGNELAQANAKDKCRIICEKLTVENAQLLTSLPDYIQDMLLADRDSHGNLPVSLIPTEQLIIDMTHRRIRELDANVPFATLNHFFGYEGRCGAPSLFDAAYSYNLGLTAGSLVLAGKTGYMASVTDLSAGGAPLAIPLTGLLNVERRQGKDEFVIEKALVDMESAAMKFFLSRRDVWASEDCFASPGPRQLWGPASRQLPMTVALNNDALSLNFCIGD